IDVVQSRKLDELNADVLHGHFSAALCHLGNISYRLGEPVPFNTLSRSFGNAPQVQETVENLTANLRGVGVELDKTTWQLGRTLTFDPQNERVTGEAADRANALLTRAYREPFVVRENV